MATESRATDAMRKFAANYHATRFGGRPAGPFAPSDAEVEATVRRAFVDADLSLEQVRALQMNEEVSPDG